MNTIPPPYPCSFPTLHIQLNLSPVPQLRDPPPLAGVMTCSSIAHTQVSRAREIKAHFAQSQAAQGAENRKAAEKAASGVIANLGLVHESS